MKTILVPVFNERISSRLDCTENFRIVKVERKKIIDIESIQIVAKNQLEKMNLILSLEPNTVICNGLTDLYKNELIKNNIKIIPWIHGRFEDVIKNYINGNINLVDKEELEL
jgi:predicted Fe-Mo cluster-binding NifX family protein